MITNQDFYLMVIINIFQKSIWLLVFNSSDDCSLKDAYYLQPVKYDMNQFNSLPVIP